jgi:hypothetical protein
MKSRNDSRGGWREEGGEQNRGEQISRRQHARKRNCRPEEKSEKGAMILDQ